MWQKNTVILWKCVRTSLMWFLSQTHKVDWHQKTRLIILAKEMAYVYHILDINIYPVFGVTSY